jgi:hypothetical protein
MEINKGTRIIIKDIRNDSVIIIQGRVIGIDENGTKNGKFYTLDSGFEILILN